MAWLQVLMLTIALTMSRGDDEVQLLAPGYALGYASRYANNYAQRTPRPPVTSTSAYIQHDQVIHTRSASEEHQDNEVPNTHATSQLWNTKTDGERRILSPPHPPTRATFDAEPILSTTSLPSVSTDVSEADDDQETHVTFQRRLSNPADDGHPSRIIIQRQEDTHSQFETPIHTTHRPANAQAGNVPLTHSPGVTWPRERTKSAVNDKNTRSPTRQRTSTLNSVQTTPHHSQQARQLVKDSSVTHRSVGDRQSSRREQDTTPVDIAARRHMSPQRHVGRPFSTAPPVTPTLPPRVPPRAPPRAPPRRDASGRSASRRAERVSNPPPLVAPPPSRSPSRTGRTQNAHLEEVHRGHEGRDVNHREVKRPTIRNQAGRRNEIDNGDLRDVKGDIEELVVPRESKGFYTRLFEAVGDRSTTGTNQGFEKSTKVPLHKSELSDHTLSPEIESKKSLDIVAYSNKDHDIKPSTNDNREVKSEDVHSDSAEEREKHPSQLRDLDSSERQDQTLPRDHSMDIYSDNRSSDRSSVSVHDSTNKYNDMKEYRMKELPQSHEHDSNRENFHDHSIKNVVKDVKNDPKSETISRDRLDDSLSKRTEEKHSQQPPRVIDISPITFTYPEEHMSPQPYHYNYPIANENTPKYSQDKSPNQPNGPVERAQNHPDNQIPPYRDQSKISVDKPRDQSQNQSLYQLHSLDRSITQTPDLENYRSTESFQSPKYDPSSVRLIQQSENQYEPRSQNQHDHEGGRSRNSHDVGHDNQKRPHIHQISTRLIDESQNSQALLLNQAPSPQDVSNDRLRSSLNNAQHSQSHTSDQLRSHEKLLTAQLLHAHNTAPDKYVYQQNRPVERYRDESGNNQQYQVQEIQEDQHDSPRHQSEERSQERLILNPITAPKSDLKQTIIYPYEPPVQSVKEKPHDRLSTAMPDLAPNDPNGHIHVHSERPQVASYEQENYADDQSEDVTDTPTPKPPPTRPPHRSSISNPGRRNNRWRDRGRQTEREQYSQDNAPDDTPVATPATQACASRRGRIARGCANRNNRLGAPTDPQQGKTRRRDAYGNQRPAVARQRQEWDEPPDYESDGGDRSAAGGRQSGFLRRLQSDTADDNSLLQAEEEAWAMDDWGGEAWDWGAASASGFFDYLPAWESFRTSPRTRPAEANALVEEDVDDPPPPPPPPTTAGAGGWRRRNRRPPPPPPLTPPPPQEEEVQPPRKRGGGRHRNRGLQGRKPHPQLVSAPQVWEDQEVGGKTKDTSHTEGDQNVRTVEGEGSGNISPDSNSGRSLEVDNRHTSRLTAENDKRPDLEEVSEDTSKDISTSSQQKEEKASPGGENHRLGYIYPLSERLDKKDTHKSFDVYIPRVKLNFDRYPLHDPSVYRPKYLEDFSLPKEKDDAREPRKESGESSNSNERPSQRDRESLERNREKERERERNYEWEREKEKELDQEPNGNRAVDRDRDWVREREQDREREIDTERDRERGEEIGRPMKEKELPLAKAGGSGKCVGKECDDEAVDRAGREYGNDEQTAASRRRLVSKHRPVLDIHGWDPFADWD